MSYLKFDGTDPILVFAFLYPFVAETDILGMSEAQAFKGLPHFLSGFALLQYRSGIGFLIVNEGGVNNWPGVVQYLPLGYATSEAIGEAILTLRDVTQKPGEKRCNTARGSIMLLLEVETCIPWKIK